MINVKRLSLACVILLASVLGQLSANDQRLKQLLDRKRPALGRGLSETPLNDARLIGSTIILRCRCVEPPPISRIMWAEFITHPGGNIISENQNILDHPNRDRYRIIHESPTDFSLEIRDVVLEDGGRYACFETINSDDGVFFGEAELIVLDSNPNCTTTAPPNGNVVEGQKYTIECIIHYRGIFPPKMTWTGPPPFLEGNSPPNPTTVWSGIEYVVHRSMDLRSYRCLTNFSDSDFSSLPEGSATNTPTYSHTFQGNQIFVFWGPMNTTAYPILPAYQVGDQINCTADAMPPASFQWQNMGNFNITPGATFTVTPNMVGLNTTVRCQAQNVIQGFVYSENLFIWVYVPAPTSPTTTVTTPTTPTLPAFGTCKDMSGWWRSTNPFAELILETIPGSSVGEVRGIQRTQDDTVWVEVIGTARYEDFLYVGLTAIWPFDDGVTGWAGECHSCYGNEIIMTQGLWRTIQASDTCGVGSGPVADQGYRYEKMGSASILREMEFDVVRPTKEVSGRLGINLKKK